MSPGERRAFEADLKMDKELKEEFRLVQMGKDILYGEEMPDEILNDPGMKDVEEDARRMADAWIAGQENKEKVKSEKLKGKRKALKVKSEKEPTTEEELGEAKPSQQGKDIGRKAQGKLERQKAEQNTKHFRLLSWVSLAAAGLVSAILLIRALMLPHITEKLYENYYSGLDPASFTIQEMPPEIAGEFSSGMEFYKEGEFEKAALSFKGIAPYGDTYPDIPLFLGISELEGGDTEKALENFEISLETEGPHIEYALFYRGFCSLRLGHPKPALLVLTELSGVSKELDDSALKLLRRANLIYTGRFKEFKREVEEEGPPEAVIGPGQWIMIILVAISFNALVLGLLSLILLPILAYREVRSGNYERREEIIWKTVIIGIPYAGSVIYFLFKFKRGKKKSQ